MEVVVTGQRISRHVDAGFLTLETRVTVVANRLNLNTFVQQKTLLHSLNLSSPHN